MPLKLKAFGVVLVATIAISGPVVSSAYAGSFLTGEQIKHNGSSTHTLTTTGKATVSCASVVLSGTIAEKHETATVTPVYEGCMAKFGATTLPATITTSICDFFFKAGEEDKVGHFAGGTASLTCPEGTGIAIDIYQSEAKHKEGITLCVLTVPSFSGEATFQNTATSPADVDLTTSIEGLTVLRSGSILCGPTSQTATYTGATTLKGYNDEAHTEQVGLRIGPETPFLTGEVIEHNGSVKHTLNTEGGNGTAVSCTSATFPGNIDEKHETLTITPSYEGCTAKVGTSTLPATVTMNGCDYLFEAGIEKEVGHFPESTASLICPEGQKAEFKIYLSEANHKAGTVLCTIKVSPYSKKAGATFKNTSSSPSDVDLTTSITGISVERTGSILCGSPITATYTGATTLKGYGDEAHTEQVDLGIG